MNGGWDYLSGQQQAAAKAAANLLEDAGLRFMMLLFGANKAGAILANIEPADSVKLIEGALAAAKATVDIIEIQPEGRLQ